MKIESVANTTKASAVPPSPMVIVLRPIAISAISSPLCSAPKRGPLRRASHAEETVVQPALPSFDSSQTARPFSPHDFESQPSCTSQVKRGYGPSAVCVSRGSGLQLARFRLHVRNGPENSGSLPKGFPVGQTGQVPIDEQA